jgi:hypothetical protein
VTNGRNEYTPSIKRDQDRAALAQAQRERWKIARDTADPLVVWPLNGEISASAFEDVADDDGRMEWHIAPGDKAKADIGLGKPYSIIIRTLPRIR